MDHFTDYFRRYVRISFHGLLSTDYFPRITFVDMYGLLSTDHFPRIIRMIRKEIEDDEKTFFFQKLKFFRKSFGFKKKIVFHSFICLFPSIMTHGSLP